MFEIQVRVQMSQLPQPRVIKSRAKPRRAHFCRYDFFYFFDTIFKIFTVNSYKFLRHQGGAEGGRGGGAAPPSFGVAQCRGFSPDP